MAALLASLATLREATPERGALPQHPSCCCTHVAGQPPGFFAGVRAYHDALPDAYYGCDRCAAMSAEHQDLHETTELIRLKSRQGLAPLPS